MNIFLIILASVLGPILLVLLLLCLLVKVRVIYDGGVSVKVGALFLWFALTPKKKKLLDPSKEEKKKKKKANKAAEKLKKKHKKAEKKETAKKNTKTNKASVRELIGFYGDLTKRIFLPALAKFGRKLHVKVKKLKIEISSPDAGKTAVLYGEAVAGGTALLEMLRGAVKLKMGREKDIYIVARFDKTEMSAQAELQIGLRPLPTVIALAPAFFRFLAEKQAFDQKIAQKAAQIPTDDINKPNEITEEELCQTANKTN